MPSNTSPSFAPGNRAVLRSSTVVPGFDAGTIVWVKRVMVDQAEVYTQEIAPRTVVVPVAALAAFPDAESLTPRPEKSQRPSLVVQVLRPVALFVIIYFVWRGFGWWPRYEEARPLPSPPVQRPAMPRERFVPPPALPAEGR